MKDIGGHHDLYLDVVLLANVFETFRKTCLQYYKLGPPHYFASLRLSWDPMLKMTDIMLDLMDDVNVFQFNKKGMCGGISYIVNLYGTANKYIKEYDEKVPSMYVMYLDTYNLYGWAMSQYLLTGGFRWLTEKRSIR